MQLSSYPRVPHVPPNSFSLIWQTSQCWERRRKHEAPSHAIFTSLILLLSPDVHLNTVIEHLQLGYFSHCRRPRVTQHKTRNSILVLCILTIAGPSGRAVHGVGLRPLACWSCGFEFCAGITSVSCEWSVLSSRGLCDKLITRPEESYRLWCVVVCDLETSRMRRSWPALGRSATENKIGIRNCCSLMAAKTRTQSLPRRKF
jgi:hypothetical protein